MSLDIDPTDFPLLFIERQADWASLTLTFEMELIPEDLISNVSVCAHVGDDWALIRLDDGWPVAGGTWEPEESYQEAAKRELLEEAGAELINLELFGGFRMVTSEDKPYRPHLPYPISYRAIGLGEVRLVGKPTNPPDGEQVREVGRFPLDEACKLLSKGSEPIGELHQLAAEVKRQLGV